MEQFLITPNWMSLSVCMKRDTIFDDQWMMEITICMLGYLMNMYVYIITLLL